MRILFFTLISMVFLMICSTSINESFGEEQSIEKWEQDIEYNWEKYFNDNEFKMRNITKGGFDKSFEQFYNHTRAWNNTMYDKYEKGEFEKRLPHDWWTGVTLYRVGEISPAAGTYELDFNYWIQIFDENDPTDFQSVERDGKLIKLFDIDFVNSVDVEFKETKARKQKNHYYDVMGSGEFFSEMDFRKFPFETLNLKIIVEPGFNVPYDDKIFYDDIQFQRWPYPALFEEGVPSPEYDIIDYSVSIEDHKYSAGGTFSRYTTNFEIQRDFQGAFLKFIFPIIVMTSLAGAALLFPSQEYMTKIELNAIFLLGILFFVQFVVEGIPATGEMTIFDKVVILSYLVIIVTIAIPALKWKERRKFERKEEDYAEWKDQDRRYHDLSVEKQRRIQSRMTYLAEKIQLSNDQKEKELIETELNELEKLRIHVTNLKRMEDDMSIIAADSEFTLCQKKEKIDLLEERRIVQANLIERKEGLIKNMSEIEPDEKYDREEYGLPEKVFNKKLYFEDLEQLEIVTWKYSDDSEKLGRYNIKMNKRGALSIAIISVCGFVWILSVFT